MLQFFLYVVSSVTPAARVAAAIEILDEVIDGSPAEKALTNWARRSRFAGSGDRAAVRDLVFDVLRRWRSSAWVGGVETGRGRMIGALILSGTDPSTVFTGIGHGPEPLNEDEKGEVLDAAPLAVRLDMPDWLMPALAASLGNDLEPVLDSLRHRAPVFLRVNLKRTTRESAMNALTSDGIETAPNALSESSLKVLTNPRKIQNSQYYLDGLVEIQDAASQSVVEALPLRDGLRVLDYCAGGGGKALAMAARADLDLTAHDANPGRMRDLPVRAERAGVLIKQCATEALGGPFDLVLCDAPCSGSGAWRRSPENKWRLTAEGLEEVQSLQARILHDASGLVAPNGHLAYVTCSLLETENQKQIENFVQGHPDWSVVKERRLTPLDGGDGFYLALLRR